VWTDRVLLAADELGARGRSKGGAGDGEQPWRALQTQEVVRGCRGVRQVRAFKGEGSTPLAGRRWRWCGGEEWQCCVPCMRLVVWGGARVHPGTVSSAWTSYSVVHAIVPV
jgi:hypothetical protein